MDEDLQQALMSIYSLDQLRKLVEVSREVEKIGHGDITITFKNHYPRFIGKRISEDFTNAGKTYVDVG